MRDQARCGWMTFSVALVMLVGIIALCYATLNSVLSLKDGLTMMVAVFGAGLALIKLILDYHNDCLKQDKDNSNISQNSNGDFRELDRTWFIIIRRKNNNLPHH